MCNRRPLEDLFGLPCRASEAAAGVTHYCCIVFPSSLGVLCFHAATTFCPLPKYAARANIAIQSRGSPIEMIASAL